VTGENTLLRTPVKRGRRQEHNSPCTATSQITYCGVSENIPTHPKALESPWGRGLSKSKSSKKKFRTKTGISGRLGSNQQQTSVGGVWILSGTTIISHHKMVRGILFNGIWVSFHLPSAMQTNLHVHLLCFISASMSEIH